MSKHKTAFKCLGCDAINAHVTVTSRNALQLLSRDSGTCRYHRHLTEFVRKRMPLITVTHSPEAVRQPSFSQLPREQLHPSHGDQKQQPPLQQVDQQVLAQEQQTLQDQDELSTNPSSSSCQDEQSLSEYSVQSSSSDHSDHELTVPTHSTHCSSSRQKRQPLIDVKNTQSSSRDRTPFDYPSDEMDTERKRRTQQRKKDMKK